MTMIKEYCDKIDEAQESLMKLYRDYVSEGLKRIPEGDVLNIKTHVLGAPDKIWDYEIKRQGKDYEVKKKTIILKDNKSDITGNSLSTKKRTLDSFLKWDIWFDLCAWEQLHDYIRFYDSMKSGEEE